MPVLIVYEIATPPSKGSCLVAIGRLRSPAPEVPTSLSHAFLVYSPGATSSTPPLEGFVPRRFYRGADGEVGRQEGRFRFPYLITQSARKVLSIDLSVVKS